MHKSNKIKILADNAVLKLRKLYYNKDFKLAAAAILLITASFLAGMAFNSIINPSNSTPKSSNVAGARITPVITKEVVRGNITEIILPLIKIRTNTNEIKEIEIVEKSIFVSTKSGALKSSDLKVGDMVLVYTNRSAQGTLTVDRLRLM